MKNAKCEPTQERQEQIIAMVEAINDVKYEMGDRLILWIEKDGTLSCRGEVAFE